MADPSMRTLVELLGALSGVHGAGVPPYTVVSGVSADSRRVAAGELFVAVEGTDRDGHDYVREAVERGAAAVVVTHAVEAAGVPVIQVEDSRRAVAELAAAWYAHPAARLPIVGVTGTFGKTTVLAMLDAILTASDRRVGAIGSEAVGVRFAGAFEEKSRLTTPDPIELQRHLKRMADRGAELVLLEVTSQGLAQQRVHGLEFELGIFTTLAPLEHAEYHGTFRNYVEAKRLFFRHLRPNAPLIYGSDARALRALVRETKNPVVGCGAGGDAAVRIAQHSVDASGTRLTLLVNRPLPRPAGGVVGPLELGLELRLLGRPAVQNAALAATAALSLGVAPDVIRRTLGAFPPPWRRIEILHHEPYTILDDTAGHPESLIAVFDVVDQLPRRRLHIVFAIRGQRGAEVNGADAEALTIWARRAAIDTLVVTPSRDGVEATDRVQPEEERAFVSRLEAAGLPYVRHETVTGAVRHGLERMGEGDLLLLLGAQGMDRGRDVVAGWLRERGIEPERDVGDSSAPGR